MNQQKLQELEKRLEKLRQQDARADLKPALRAALHSAQDDKEKAFILSRLASEWQLELARLPFDDKHKDGFNEAEAVIRECLKLQPDDPYHWIRLAEHFHYYATDFAKALQAINAAIEKAEKDRVFVRQAHSTRIRIALELKDYALVEKSLEVLTTYSPSPNKPDVALEHDFLKKIPPGAVRDDLVARYKAIL
jgi:tetratricopeptide (TPR) repeat protein